MAENHYDTDVNKGSLNMRSFTSQLNERYEKGWKLAKVFEQEGNTILIWERIN
jgi:hypothetical protein